MKSEEDLSEEKVFAPYEHIIFKRIYLGPSKHYNFSYNIENGDTGQVETPVGYEYLQSHYFSTYFDEVPVKLYVDVWFINYVEVKAKATYNRFVEANIYQTPGMPTSNVLEKPKGPSYRLK